MNFAMSASNAESCLRYSASRSGSLAAGSTGKGVILITPGEPARKAKPQKRKSAA